MSLNTIFNKKSISVFALAAFSLAVHFAWFGTPNSAVFDEVHFGKFISAYFTNEYYFDIHPPLGKLVLAAWGWLWGFKPGFSFANIGDVYPDHLYLALRFLPALAGALLPLVIYGLARQLKMSRVASVFAGMLVALDNALLVQSRLILLDSFLLLFGFGGLWCYLKSQATNYKMQTFWLASAGILAGMAISIKWTGATFWGLIVILELLRLWADRHTMARRRLGLLIACLIVLPALVYVGTFAVHFALLTKSGTGDAFMTAEFQRDLQGNTRFNDPSLRSLSLPDKIIQLNEEMYRSNQRLTATHPYSSVWYTWPFMDRPIFYWIKDQARIYLLGNPLIWWASTAAVLAVFVDLLLGGLRAAHRSVLLMGGAWLMNILPFIGITRVMFLYHYFTALIWAILLLAWLVDQQRHRTRIAVGLGVLALASFVFFAPLSYGLPLTDSAYNSRVLFNSWR